MSGLEELERGLLVAAHIRLEDRALRLHRSLLQHIAHVQRVAVASHHVRPAGVAGRPRPEHVTHRPDDVRLHLAELRPFREATGRRAQRGRSAGRRGALQPSCKSDGIFGVLANKARCTRHSVVQHICSEPTGGRRSLHPTRHRGGETALGVRQRHEDLLLRAAGLRSVPVGLLELVGAELDDERTDDRDRDHGGAGVRLLRAAPGFVVESEGLVADDVADRFAPRRDRLRVVLARQAHRQSLFSCP